MNGGYAGCGQELHQPHISCAVQQDLFNKFGRYEGHGIVKSLGTSHASYA